MCASPCDHAAIIILMARLRSPEFSAANAQTRLKEAWDHADADGGGTLDKDEVREVLLEMDFDEETMDLDAIFEQIDEDGGGEVDFEEFKTWFSQGKGAVDIKSLRTALQTLRFRINFFKILKVTPTHPRWCSSAYGLRPGLLLPMPTLTACPCCSCTLPAHLS